MTPLVISFVAVIRVVTQCSSPTNGCSLELCIPFPLLLRTNDMHVTVSSCTNHISRYICRQRSRFPRKGSLLLIGQFNERNAKETTPLAKWGDQLQHSWNIHSIKGSISLKTRLVFRSPVRLEGRKVLHVNWLRMNNWRFLCRMSFAAANSIATKTKRKKTMANYSEL